MNFFHRPAEGDAFPRPRLLGGDPGLHLLLRRCGGATRSQYSTDITFLLYSQCRLLPVSAEKRSPAFKNHLTCLPSAARSWRSLPR